MATKAASSANMVADATNLNAVSGAGARQEPAGTCNDFTAVPVQYLCTFALKCSLVCYNSSLTILLRL